MSCQTQEDMLCQATSLLATRRALSQFRSFKIRRTTFLNCMKFVDSRILRHVGQPCQLQVGCKTQLTSIYYKTQEKRRPLFSAARVPMLSARMPMTTLQNKFFFLAKASPPPSSSSTFKISLPELRGSLLSFFFPFLFFFFFPILTDISLTTTDTRTYSAHAYIPTRYSIFPQLPEYIRNTTEPFFFETWIFFRPTGLICFCSLNKQQ